ncbi:bifunctional ornithine acetyltransferase/N-acetylglutamate synthase [Streptomyces sp. NPDC005963]|uniref:bifunctional ornithine acetyltransferase/N-acetylglutamate synthase n=1 Tax=Streptomyces sp. NPDC005963 TaxID=3156721 RepID=UPI003410A748
MGIEQNGTRDLALVLNAGPCRAAAGAFTDKLLFGLAGAATRLAEGVTKEIRIEVVNAGSVKDAIEVGRSVARDNLLKGVLHGEGSDWGRVLSAIGTTHAGFALVDRTGREVAATVDLVEGAASTVIWTNDLIADYVHENGEYAS